MDTTTWRHRLTTVWRHRLSIYLLHRPSGVWRHRLAAVAVGALLAGGHPGAAPALANGGAKLQPPLRAEYARLQPQLDDNPFHRPLRLESVEDAGRLQGDVYARVDHSFSTVAQVLSDPAQWCDILLLHLNTKGCRVTGEGEGRTLVVHFGTKHDESLESAHRVDFDFANVARTQDQLDVELVGTEGPLDTSDYRVVLRAVPIGSGQTFLHLSYAYSMGLASRIVMRTYFNTIGRSKVGFTVVDRDASGAPIYIGDLRGALERNTMRYYLAIDAYLDALGRPQPDRVDARMRQWFAATERYPLQLRELGQAEYLKLKRRDLSRHAGQI